MLETEPSIRNPESAETPDPERRGELEFRSVSFAYPGAEEDVLTDVSFTARRGETVAFIGSTGSGKSTLVNLIPRFFDVSKGEILRHVSQPAPEILQVHTADVHAVQQNFSL